MTIENFLRVRIVDAMGEAYDVVPTPGELEAYVNENFGGIEAVTTQMSGVGVPSSRPDLVLDYLRFVYIENAVRELKRDEMGIGEGQSDELDLAMKEIEDEFSSRAKVSVNPRYGTWNGSAMTSSTLSGSGSISIVPTDEPARPRAWSRPRRLTRAWAVSSCSRPRPGSRRGCSALDAWDVLRAADEVWYGAAGHPQLPALRHAGVALTRVDDPPRGVGGAAARRRRRRLSAGLAARPGRRSGAVDGDQ